MIKYQLLSPPNNNRFLRLLHPVFCRRPDVAGYWQQQQQGRCLVTAAARDTPINSKTRKMLSSNERKLMVEAYVNKYREMNAGKFPTASNVQEQVGGGYYNVRAILQELEYNSKLSTIANAVKISTFGKIALKDEISDAEVAPDSQVSDDTTSVVKNYDISAECDSNHEGVTDKSSCHKMVSVSTLNKNHDITSKYVPGSERKVDLELQGEHNGASGDVDISDNDRILKSRVPLVENSSADETLMAVVKDTSRLPAMPGYYSEATGKSRHPEELDEAFDQAFDSDESIRCREKHFGNFSTLILNKKQVNDCYYDDSAINQVLNNTTVEADVDENYEDGRTLDCQVRAGRNVTADEHRVSAGNDSSSQKKVGSYSCQKMIDTSILIKSKEVTADEACRRERTADLELSREHYKTSLDVDGGDFNRPLGSRELSRSPSLVKTTSAASNVKVGSNEGCEFLVKPIHPSEAPGTSQKLDIGEREEASAQASKCKDFSRANTQKKTEDKDVQKSSLWGNLKLLASNLISIWRKT